MVWVHYEGYGGHGGYGGYGGCGGDDPHLMLTESVMMKSWIQFNQYEVSTIILLAMACRTTYTPRPPCAVAPSVRASSRPSPPCGIELPTITSY